MNNEPRKVRWQNDALKFTTEEMRNEVIRLYCEEEFTMTAIAERFNATGRLDINMTRVHVAKILEMARVPLRSRRDLGMASATGKREPIPGIDAEYEIEGASLEALMTKYHIGKDALRSMLNEMGVTIRGPGQGNTPKSKR